MKSFEMGGRSDSIVSTDTQTDDTFSFSIWALLPTSATIAIMGDTKTIEQVWEKGKVRLEGLRGRYL